MSEASDEELLELIYKFDFLTPKNKADLDAYLPHKNKPLEEILKERGYFLPETVDALIFYTRLRKFENEIINWLRIIPLIASKPLELDTQQLMTDTIVREQYSNIPHYFLAEYSERN